MIVLRLGLLTLVQTHISDNPMQEEDAVELLAWFGFIAAVFLCVAVGMKIAHYYGYL